jgi:hypothetical protein
MRIGNLSGRPGDELVSEIEGIGAMRHQFVSA